VLWKCRKTCIAVLGLRSAIDHLCRLDWIGASPSTRIRATKARHTTTCGSLQVDLFSAHVGELGRDRERDLLKETISIRT